MSTIDIGPRTEEKRLRDIERIYLLIKVKKDFNEIISDFKGEHAIFYSAFVKCMENIVVPPIKQIVIFSTQTVTINTIHFPESESINKLVAKLKKGSTLVKSAIKNEEDILLEEMKQEVLAKENEVLTKIQKKIDPDVISRFKAEQYVFYVPPGVKETKYISKEYKVHYNYIKNIFKPKFERLVKEYIIEVEPYIRQLSGMKFDISSYFNKIYGFQPGSFDLELLPMIAKRADLP